MRYEGAPFNHHTQVICFFQDYFKSDFTGIEIGTAEALLTKSLLLYIPQLTHIYAIDPYMHNPNSWFEANRPQEWQDDRYNQAVIALAEYAGRYTLLRHTSDDAVSLTPDKVDFVWIDGEHGAEQVKRDIINYYPKVASGGVFGGHDSQLSIEHVKAYTDEDIFLGADLTWWLIKK